uniref:Pentacotripeptide-repeat region of PRORP domain-containing protein n=1 Tax=Oryza rufipogon TaxID=4529 RepID=A0A0E0MZA3_ORYRU
MEYHSTRLQLLPIPAHGPIQLQLARVCSATRHLARRPLAGGGGGAIPHRVLRGACTTAPASRPPPYPLSPSDLDAVSALLPRLVSAGNVPAAGRLLTAALLLPGSTERLPFSPLAAHLASMPTLTPAFALLTAIRHHPLRPSPLPLATPLLGHLLSRRRAREAASVVRWLCRPDSPQRPDSATFAVAVAGLCRLEDPRNALAALREMAVDGIRTSAKLRESVRDAMLQDARIEEAWALEAAMKQPDSGKLAELVQKLLEEWED